MRAVCDKLEFEPHDTISLSTEQRDYDLAQQSSFLGQTILTEPKDTLRGKRELKKFRDMRIAAEDSCDIEMVLLYYYMNRKSSSSSSSSSSDSDDFCSEEDRDFRK